MLRIEGLEYIAGNFKLGPIELTIENREYHVILGPAGAGKTTLLQLLCGLRKEKGGKIYLDNRDLTELQPEARNIGYVSQRSMLFPHLNVKENIAFGLSVRRYPRKFIEERITDVSELIGIRSLLQRAPTTLSGGESRMVSLARALAHKPAILLLDEPLSALDVLTRKTLQKKLKDLKAHLSCPTIHVTHDLEEALFLADSISIMKEGRILQSGKPDEIFMKPSSKFVAEFTGAENILHGWVRKVKPSSPGESNAIFETQGLRLSVITEKEGEAYAVLRAKDIILSREQVVTSALNNFRGKVMDVIKENTLYRVVVDAGIQFQVVITEQSLEKLDIKRDQEVNILFKASSVHII